MTEPGSTQGSIAAALRRLAESASALVLNRLKLASLELEAQKVRLIELLVKVAVTLAFGFVAMLLGTLTLAIYVWETARYAGLLLMFGVFLLATTFLLWRLRQDLRKEPRPFEKTLSELEKDHACLRTKN